MESTNTPPTILDIDDLTLRGSSATDPLTFTVGDAETPVNDLDVTATSSDSTLVTNNNIVLGGTGSNRTVTITPESGQYGTVTITLEVVDGDDTATDTSFTLTLGPDHFWPSLDGLDFDNFSFTGADWEDFKQAFPQTEMELPDGTRRLGPELFFLVKYRTIGHGGNCAGMAAVSLIRYLNLPETVERSVLLPATRQIENAHDLPHPSADPINPNVSDVADYVHLYQARQVSSEFAHWWTGDCAVSIGNAGVSCTNSHDDDTPLETFNAIKQHTSNDEPMRVSIRGGAYDTRTNKWFEGGHAMTAYRTEEQDGFGYIYVYDSNKPNDNDSSIQVNLQTGEWEYEMLSTLTWSETTNLRYSPASLNFPAALPGQYDWDISLASQNQSDYTLLDVAGDAELLITDEQGNQLGYTNGTIVSDIPGATPLYNYQANPDIGTVDDVMGFVVTTADELDYRVEIVPTSQEGSYTLTAFGSGSAMQYQDVQVQNGQSDTLIISGDILNTTFTATGDDTYCHTITREVSSTASRELTSCLSDAAEASINFQLADDGQSMTIDNQGNDAVQTQVTVHQVGTEAGTHTYDRYLPPNDIVVVEQGHDGSWSTTGGVQHAYLPLIRR